MPRANLSKQLPLQSAWGAVLLKSPPADHVIKSIRAVTRSGDRISPTSLGALLGVAPASLNEQLRIRLPHGRKMQSRGFSEPMAIEALRGYLPRVLKWQSVADLAKSCGIHRNIVESLVLKFGKPGMLMYALDKRMYVSPAGQRIVQDKLKELKAFGNRSRLRAFANQQGVPLNYVTAFFAGRKIVLERDPLGRVRLTAEQEAMFKESRSRIQARKAHRDISIDGATYRSVIKVAEQKAALFASPGTQRYAVLAARAENALRYWGRNAGFSKKTPIGVYIPEVIATRYKNSISISEAARLMVVSRSTMKKWCVRNPALLAPEIPGKTEQGVALTTLLEFGWKEKYSQEPKLRKRGQVPVAFVSFALLGVAGVLGVSYDKIVASLPVRAEVKEALEKRDGLIPRAVHRQLVAVIEDKLPILGTSKLTKRELAPHLRNYVRMLMLYIPDWSASAALASLDKVATVRSESPESIYDSLYTFFGSPESWPVSFEALRRKAGGRSSRLMFPMLFGNLLARMEEPERKVITYSDDAIPDVKVGDIFLHPPTRDFGIVSRVLQHGPATEVHVNLVVAARSGVFSFE